MGVYSLENMVIVTGFFFSLWFCFRIIEQQCFHFKVDLLISSTNPSVFSSRVLRLFFSPPLGLVLVLDLAKALELKKTFEDGCPLKTKRISFCGICRSSASRWKEGRVLSKETACRYHTSQPVAQPANITVSPHPGFSHGAGRGSRAGGGVNTGKTCG